LPPGGERGVQAIDIKQAADHFGKYKIYLGCILSIYWFPSTHTLLCVFKKPETIPHDYFERSQAGGYNQNMRILPTFTPILI